MFHISIRHPVIARGMAVTYFELFVHSLQPYPFFDECIITVHDRAHFQVHDWEFSLWLWLTFMMLF